MTQLNAERTKMKARTILADSSQPLYSQFTPLYSGRCHRVPLATKNVFKKSLIPCAVSYLNFTKWPMSFNPQLQKGSVYVLLAAASMKHQNLLHILWAISVTLCGTSEEYAPLFPKFFSALILSKGDRLFIHCSPVNIVHVCWSCAVFV